MKKYLLSSFQPLLFHYYILLLTYFNPLSHFVTAPPIAIEGADEVSGISLGLKDCGTAIQSRHRTPYPVFIQFFQLIVTCSKSCIYRVYCGPPSVVSSNQSSFTNFSISVLLTAFNVSLFKCSG